ncbi:peptidoglycan-binding domain-containing protein [Streptomyces sp. NPDC001774]
MAEYKPPPFPVGLHPGGTKPSAQALQRALKAAGYLASSVGLADAYGPATQAAVKKFHAANPAFGRSSDPAIGPLGWAELHREAYAPKAAGSVEPVHDYRRVTYSGRTVNVRTRVMLEAAASIYGGSFVVLQGSYNRGGVSASAGTHDGGGVVDIDALSMSSAKRLKALKALRQVGFAAWLRTPAEGFGYHFHACAIGDREMASVARSQVRDYFNGRSGLASGTRDTASASVGRPWPAWANKYR